MEIKKITVFKKKEFEYCKQQCPFFALQIDIFWRIEKILVFAW